MIDIKTVKIILIILIVKKSNISLADKGNNQTVTPADPPKREGRKRSEEDENTDITTREEASDKTEEGPDQVNIIEI